jgi:hypothetical protein
MILTDSGKKYKIEFEELERRVFDMCMSEGRAIMSEIMSELDEQLFKNCDKKVYKSEGRRKTNLKTLMGAVDYSRRVYRTPDESGGNDFVFLLDEMLGIDAPGKMSNVVSTLIATSACESDYREVSEKVSTLSGLSISHTTAWSVTQAVGARVLEHGEELATRAKNNAGTGQIESNILFEELDGVWLKLQGESRKRLGHSKEMKVAIAYDGIKEMPGGRRRLSDKVACASFEGVKDFIELKEGVIASVYNVDEIELRVLNGDGASWISAQTDADTIYQLDPFHRNRAIRKFVNDPDLCREMLTLLYNQEIDMLLKVIDASINSTEDEYEQEKRKALYNYFNNNKDALTSYTSRGVDIPEVNPGLLSGTCGAMESNVFTMVGNRMKGGRESWSVEGANHLAALLCLKQTGRLEHTLSVMGEKMPSAQFKGILSAAKAHEKVGKGYSGFKRAEIPNMSWIKGLLGLKPLSKLRF